MGYPKDVYDRARQELERRAGEARRETAARREEIRERIPEIGRIERELAATAASVARVVVADPNHAGERIDALQRQNLELQRRRAQLLATAGYPADYLAERHGCDKCRDAGYVGSRMCGCFEELLRRAAYAQLGAVSQARACSFDNFSLHYYPEGAVDASGVAPRRRMAEILDRCKRYAREFGPEADSLLLLGRTGLGKTHLSLAIATQVTEAGHGVVYTPVQKLMDRLEAEKFSRGESREHYTDSLDYVLGCDLLVLDDLGTEFYTQFTGAVLYNIINSRLVEGRPTIISTNLELPQIEEKYSQRMVSRLVCSYQVLKFYGKDIRFIKMSERG